MKIIKLGKTAKLSSIPLLALLAFGCGYEDKKTDTIDTPDVIDTIDDIDVIDPASIEGLYAAITDTDDSAAGSLKYKLSDSDENDLTAYFGRTDQLIRFEPITFFTLFFIANIYT